MSLPVATWFDTSAPKSVSIALRPSYAIADQPLSLTGPGVMSATLKSDFAAGTLSLGAEFEADVESLEDPQPQRTANANPASAKIFRILWILRFTR